MNPNLNTGAPQNLTGGKSPNNVKTNFKHVRNKFSNSYHNLITPRYGDITPFFCFEAVPGDKVPFASDHEIRSYTLSSPMMSNIKMYKTYTSVPFSAILPRAWDYIYTNPVQGDDVPDDAMCSTKKFPLLINYLFNQLKDVDDVHYNQQKIKCFLLLEDICSYGSLCQHLGYSFSHVSPITYDGKDISFDSWCEIIHEELMKDLVNVFIMDSDSNDYYQFSDSRSSYRRGIEIYRENANLTLSSGTVPNFLAAVAKSALKYSALPQPSAEPISFASLVSYQLSVAEFYSNEFVDSVYTAKLFRENAESIYRKQVVTYPSYNINGINILYDAFSGYVFDSVVDKLSDTNIDDYSLIDALLYLQLIFVFRKSMRYTDYFTSAKTRPLAVGNVTAAVVGQGVSAVDMTRSIQIQRFLNSVNRTGRRFSEYVKGIFGGEIAADRHEPHFISSTPFNVNGFEVENTAEDQGKQVTVLHSTGGKFEFTADFEEETIVIGLIHFEAVRNYVDFIDPNHFHVDRYTFFNPFLQYIGDQAIKISEYNSSKISDADNFGYQVRYAEYKKSFNRAAGGFATNALPSWSFIDSIDNREIYHLSDVFNLSDKISSEVIRSTNSEFDRFYSSLNYLGLGSYFHFIISVVNSNETLRPMEFKPNIL